MANTLLPTVPERLASDVRFRQAVLEGGTIRQLHELVGLHLFGRASVKRARHLVLNQTPVPIADRKGSPGEEGPTSRSLPAQIVSPPGSTTQVYVVTPEQATRQTARLPQGEASQSSMARRSASASARRSGRKRPPAQKAREQRRAADALLPGAVTLRFDPSADGSIVCLLEWTAPTGDQVVSFILQNPQEGTILKIEERK